MSTAKVEAENQCLIERAIGAIYQSGAKVHNLIVEMQGETMILRGTAGSYYQKQLAQQAILENFPNEVVNRIQVY